MPRPRRRSRRHTQTLITEVDVSDPAAMKVARTMTLDGQYVDARQNGATARVVLSSTPRAYAAGERARPRVGLAAALALRLEDLRAHRTPRRSSRCRAVRRPRVVLGPRACSSILTIDLDQGLCEVDADARHDRRADRLRLGEPPLRRHASAGSIRRRRPRRRCRRRATLIHRFDVADPDRTTYEASGEVPGYLLNQYSLSEQGGDLRVASTAEPVWCAGRAAGLQPELRDRAAPAGRDARPDRPGRRAGPGPAHLLGALHRRRRLRRDLPPDRPALHDRPRRPDRARRSLGAARAARLLGLPAPDRRRPAARRRAGRDAARAGRRARRSRSSTSPTRRTPSAGPARARQRQSSSRSSSTSHAFLYWAPRQLVVLPVQVFDSATARQSGAGLHRRDRTEGRPRGHRRDRPRRPRPADGYVPAINRSIVIGDQLLTVSDGGVLASALDGFARVGWLAFPQPPASSSPPSPPARQP